MFQIKHIFNSKYKANMVSELIPIKNSHDTYCRVSFQPFITRTAITNKCSSKCLNSNIKIKFTSVSFFIPFQINNSSEAVQLAVQLVDKSCFLHFQLLEGIHYNKENIKKQECQTVTWYACLKDTMLNAWNAVSDLMTSFWPGMTHIWT